MKNMNITTMHELFGELQMEVDRLNENLKDPKKRKIFDNI